MTQTPAKPSPLSLLSGLLVVALLALAACRPGPDGPLTDAERRTIAATIDSVMGAFEEAERSRDPEGLIAYLAPDFYMYTDGIRTSYDSVAASMRRNLVTMQHFEPGFDNVEVRVLGRDAALVSLTFRDSVITASGDLLLGRAGFEFETSIVAGALEMSNVDLAAEFTDMIVTQRGYQASARVVTTSDELLLEIVQLKR